VREGRGEDQRQQHGQSNRAGRDRAR